MSYLVVARKWRPQQFSEVVGQEHVTETLKFAIKTGRIAPVFLFTGIRGTGKTTLARILVKAVNCENRKENGEPCNECESCREITAGRSVDVIEIDGASNNSVDDVRAIKENISYSPVKSARKAYIIDEVHMLSKSAFNALLKTLEEPPAHTLFILATTDPQKIPTTVLSRCQRYDLKRLSIQSVVEQLRRILTHDAIAFEEEALYLIAREGEGSMRDAQTILEQFITFGEGKITESGVSLILGASDKTELRGLIEAVADHNAEAAAAIVRNLYASGKAIEKAARDLLILLHHLVLYSSLGNADYIEASDEEKRWIAAVAARLTNPEWLRLFNFWNEQYEKIKISDFSLMLFEVGMILAARMPRMADITAFLQGAPLTEQTSSQPPVQKPVPAVEAKPAPKPVAKPVSQPQPEKTVTAPSALPEPAIPLSVKPEPPAEKAVSKERPEIKKETAPEVTADVIPETKPETIPVTKSSAAGDIKPEEPLGDIWPLLVDMVKGKIPFLSSALATARFEENEHAITISATAAAMQMIDKNLDKIKELLHELSNGRKELIVGQTSKTSDSVALKQEKETEERKAKAKAEIRDDKVVRELEQLSFDLKNIKVS